MAQSCNQITDYFKGKSLFWECGKEGCNKQFLKKTNFSELSQTIRFDHFKNAHTCGYCLDESVFETIVQRYIHRQHCFAYNLLKVTNKLVANEKESSQQDRRKLLPTFLAYEHNYVYYFENVFLLYENDQKITGKKGKQHAFLVLNTNPPQRVTFQSLDNRFTRITPQNYHMFR